MHWKKRRPFSRNIYPWPPSFFWIVVNIINLVWQRFLFSRPSRYLKYDWLIRTRWKTPDCPGSVSLQENFRPCMELGNMHQIEVLFEIKLARNNKKLTIDRFGLISVHRRLQKHKKCPYLKRKLYLFKIDHLMDHLTIEWEVYPYRFSPL